MITYTTSPNLKKTTFLDRFDNKTYDRVKNMYYNPVKTKLPSVQQHLFFVTDNEYFNTTHKFFSDDTKLDNMLIRANSVVEYNCGIKLPKSTNFENALGSMLQELKIKEKCTENFVRSRGGTSLYHLEHSYPKAIFDHYEGSMETKNFLTSAGFLEKINCENKEFGLHAIGVDFPKNGDSHIQIVYSDTSNGGYSKIKKSDDDPNLNELSNYAEFDAIYVNIHLSMSHNPKYKSWYKQLKTIAKQFKLVTKFNDNMFNYLVKINGYNNDEEFWSQEEIEELKTHFKTLKNNFKSLCKIAFVNSFANAKTLDDVCRKIGQTKIGNKIGNTDASKFKVKFENASKYNFLNCNIHGDKLYSKKDDSLLNMGDLSLNGEEITLLETEAEQEKSEDEEALNFDKFSSTDLEDQTAAFNDSDIDVTATMQELCISSELGSESVADLTGAGADYIS